MSGRDGSLAHALRHQIEVIQTTPTYGMVEYSAWVGILRIFALHHVESRIDSFLHHDECESWFVVFGFSVARLFHLRQFEFLDRFQLAVANTVAANNDNSIRIYNLMNFCLVQMIEVVQ